MNQHSWLQVRERLGELRQMVAEAPISTDIREPSEGRWGGAQIRDSLLRDLKPLEKALQKTLSTDPLLPFWKAWKLRNWINDYYRFSSRGLGETDLRWTSTEMQIREKDKQVCNCIEATSAG